MADCGLDLAAEQSGFIGVESVLGVDGFGMTVSNSESDDAMAFWKTQAKNQVAQEACKALWKKYCSLRIARVERAYSKRTLVKYSVSSGYTAK